jgi:hypothetical protein
MARLRRRGATVTIYNCRIYTADEAALVLRVKPRWLKRQAAARKVPFTMLAGSYRFSAAIWKRSCGSTRKPRNPTYLPRCPGSVRGGIAQPALPAPAMLRCGPGRLRGGWREAREVMNTLPEQP